MPLDQIPHKALHAKFNGKQRKADQNDVLDLTNDHLIVPIAKKLLTLATDDDDDDGHNEQW